HVSPPSPERQISLGSVPIHTRPGRAGLAVIDVIRRPSSPPMLRHERPPSSLRYIPPRWVPHHARPAAESAVTQVGRSPKPVLGDMVPRLASTTSTVLSVATRSAVMIWMSVLSEVHE